MTSFARRHSSAIRPRSARIEIMDSERMLHVALLATESMKSTQKIRAEIATLNALRQ